MISKVLGDAAFRGNIWRPDNITTFKISMTIHPDRQDKLEFPPLFSEGFTNIQESQLDELFAGSEPGGRRKFLCSHLRIFIQHLKELGVVGELWIDGSFTTKDPEPRDIDIALVMPLTHARKNLAPDAIATLTHYADEEGNAYVKARWYCDFYIVDANSFKERNYWIQTFSRTKKKTFSKGIAVIKL